MTTVQSNWTPEREAKLVQLWNIEGKSARECAEAIGISRNGIISKARRMKLNSRPSPLRPRDPNAVIRKSCQSIIMQGPQIADLTERSCRYPHGHPSEPGFRFCAATTPRFGVPYCAEHMAKCYRAIRDPDTAEDVIAAILGKPVPARKQAKRRVFGTVAA